MVCKCYNTKKPLKGWIDATTPILGEAYGVCLGTKEIERCTCNGDESLCDFYPNVRKVARERREEEQKQREEEQKQKDIEELKQMFQHLADLINKQNNEVQSM